MMRNIQILLLSLGFAFLSFGQEIQTKTNIKNIHVGEPFSLEFEIEINPKDKIQFTPKSDSIRVIRTNKEKSVSDSTSLDIISYFSQEEEKIQGKYYWRGNYELMCFEEGWFIIPPQKFVLNGKEVKSSAELIIVSLIKKKKGVDIYDIQENFQELPSPFFENAKKIILWSLMGIGVLALIIFFYFFVIKKKSGTEAQESTSFSHKEIALSELNALMEKTLWEKDQLKEHFTEISFITRRYLTQETGESHMERTSLETQLILRKKGFSDHQLKPLGLILNVSDMVKFAQSSMEKEGVYSVYQETKKFIENFELR